MNYLNIIVRRGTLVTGCILFASALSGQSSKQIREMGIQSQTVLEIFIEEGRDEPVPEKKEMYNEQGDIIELIEYSKNGGIKKWEKYEYDEEGNVTQEIQMDKRGRVSSRIKTLYENDLKTEKQYFDSRDRMYKKKMFKYDYREQ
jgi:hypothetical protein